MKKMNHYSFTFLLTLLFTSTGLFGQTVNAYKFIEPNISVSYDSGYFKIGPRYSNETYGTESYDFSYQGNPSKKFRIHIKANHPIENASKKERDSLILSGVDEIKNTENDAFSIISIDKQIRIINSFSCVGFVGYNKIEKKYSTFIGGYHYSDNDNTEVVYMSNSNDFEAEYRTLASLLSGFHSYSKPEINKEDSIIKNKYNVVVTLASTMTDEFKYRPKTYVGFVSTKEKLEHPISEVRVSFSGGFELFAPNSDGQVLILSNDIDKGVVIKKGELVLLNSFGKKVKLPFSFIYQNNGPL